MNKYWDFFQERYSDSVRTVCKKDISKAQIIIRLALERSQKITIFINRGRLVFIKILILMQMNFVLYSEYMCSSILFQKLKHFNFFFLKKKNYTNCLL